MGTERLEQRYGELEIFLFCWQSTGVDDRVNCTCISSMFEVGERCSLGESAVASGQCRGCKTDLAHGQARLRHQRATSTHIPYGPCDSCGRDGLREGARARALAIARIPARTRATVSLRFTISPAILYLVTTKSSAMVFSVSSLSAMSTIQCILAIT